tara:strand:+ start:27124 stop:27438 length:315 start_codon:yes stop_codon:yes gene_type:complete
MSRIANIEDLPNNSSCSLQVDHLDILLVKRAGQLFLYENKCPHANDTLDPMGGSVCSADGLLLHCQRHAAEFLPDTGECVGGPCMGEHLNAIAFTLSNGDIYLD